jgi:hypothetical protein
VAKRRRKKLSAGDKRVLTLLESRPFLALNPRDQTIARQVSHGSKRVIERYTISVNPAIYQHLPGTRRLYLMMIDTMRVPAETRIQEYFRTSPFLDRMTIYSTFGEIAFVGFIVGRADEVTTLADEIFTAVHEGRDAIEKNESCDMHKGIKLYSVTSAPVLCGQKMPFPMSRTPPDKAHLIKLQLAVEDALSFRNNNKALSALRQQGYAGPFTVQVDPVRVGRFVVLIPLFLADESSLKHEILSDQKLMKKVRYVYEVADMENWGDHYYKQMNYLLLCEFEGLTTDYSDWYGRLINRITQANINEFAIRTRIHETITPISDIPRMQETAGQYAVNHKEGLRLGRALIPADPAKGPEIGLSRAALSKHIMVMGVPRSGKSTSLSCIASEGQRLRLAVLFVDGKGDLVSDHGTIANPALASLGSVVIDAKQVLGSSSAFGVAKGKIAVLSVHGLEPEEYPMLFDRVLDWLERMPAVSKLDQKNTRIDRIVILDEVQRLAGDDEKRYQALETILTQAASKANCVVPVLHHFPRDRKNLIALCENRIMHRIQADAHDVEDFLGPGHATPLFEIEAVLPRLPPGSAFVSFVDAELNRLEAMQVEITGVRGSTRRETKDAKKLSRKK